MENESNGWAEWGKHVLKELDRLNDRDDDHAKLIQAMQIEIATLKVKAGAWGGLAGLIPSLGLLIYYIVKNVK